LSVVFGATVPFITYSIFESFILEQLTHGEKLINHKCSSSCFVKKEMAKAIGKKNLNSITEIISFHFIIKNSRELIEDNRSLEYSFFPQNPIKIFQKPKLPPPKYSS